MIEPLPKELQIARTILSRKHPYVAAILWSVSFKPMPGIGTLGVDKHWRCIYDPAVLQKWTQEEIVGVVFHEINHLIRDHPMRSEAIVGLDPSIKPENLSDEIKNNLMVMNLAEDAEINPDLLKCGFKLPGEPMLPSAIPAKDGLLAEEYYRLFPPKRLNKTTGIGHGKCGSCAGNPNSGEEDAPAKGQGISKGEQELIKRSVAKEIEQAGKTRGDIPAGLQRWADALLHPQVKWSKELASVVRRSIIEVMGKQDYTYKRPSRKAGCLGQQIITPGTKAFTPNVAMIIDTSGSMGTEDLQKAIAECKGVLRALGGSGYGITEIAVDCAVTVKKKVRTVGQVNLAGGGGTDMRIGLRAAEELKPIPHVVVVVTDGYTPWPTEASPFKTIVVLTQEGARDQVPEFFKCIVVN
jgi:predicted metal-dependent peptidase